MKHTKYLALIALCLFSFGCAGTTAVSTFPGPTPSGTPNPNASHDPIVVNAEKVLLIASDTFHLLDTLEYDNRAQLLKSVPEVHTYTNYLRKHYFTWLSEADDLKNVYKNNRTTTNKDRLETALTNISAETTKSQTFITKAKP